LIKTFAAPPNDSRPTVLWFWNGTVTNELTVALPLDEMGERVMNLALREPRGRPSRSRSRIERITGVLRASTAAPSAGTPR
jgi:hypothetical protein